MKNIYSNRYYHGSISIFSEDISSFSCISPLISATVFFRETGSYPEQLNHYKRLARPWEEGFPLSQRKVAKLSGALTWSDSSERESYAERIFSSYDMPDFKYPPGACNEEFFCSLSWENKILEALIEEHSNREDTTLTCLEQSSCDVKRSFFDPPAACRHNTLPSSSLNTERLLIPASRQRAGSRFPFENNKDLIFEIVNNNKDKTLKELAALISEEIGVPGSPTGVRRFISKSGYRYTLEQGWMKKKEG